MEQSTDIGSWSVQDVCLNLKGQVWADTNLLNELSKHEIDGAALLELTKHDLRDDFGIKELGKIKRILRSLSKMKKHSKRRHTAPTPSVPVYHEDEKNASRAAPHTPDLQTFDLPIEDEDLVSSADQQANSSIPPRPAPPSPTPLAAAPPPCTPPPFNEADLGALDMDIIELEDLVPDSFTPIEVLEEGNNIPPRPVTAIGHRPLNGMDCGHQHVWADDPAVHISKASDLLHDHSSEELTPEVIKQLSDKPWDVSRPSPIPRPPASEGPPGRRLPSGQRMPDWVDTPWEPPQLLCHTQPLGLLKRDKKGNFDIDLNAPPHHNGILEQERRYSDLQELYTTWVTCTGDDGPERFIAFEGLGSVLMEFCGWSEEEGEFNTTLIMNEIDSNSDGQLDWHEFFVFMTRITRSMPPTAFDNLVTFFTCCVEGVNKRREVERREATIRKIFHKIADDNSWYISEKTLRDVVVHLRNDDETSDVSELIRQGDTGVCDGVLDEDEVVCLLTKLCGEDCSGAEFDLMMFRLDRAISTRNKEAPNHISKAPKLTTDDIDTLVSLSPSSSPLILHGNGADPTNVISESATSCEVHLRLLFVSSDKSARTALCSLVRNGFSKGEWLCFSIDHTYQGSDKFLREIGVKLQTESPWSIHRKFRLWIYTPQPCIIPSILSIRSVLIDISDLDLTSIISTLEKKRNHGHGHIAMQAFHRRPT